MTGGGFEGFLQNKIYSANNESEADHVIRRAFAICRLHYEEISDGIEQVEQKLTEMLGSEWKADFLSRNNENARTDKSNAGAKK